VKDLRFYFVKVAFDHFVIEMIEMVQDFGPVFRLVFVRSMVDFDQSDRNRKWSMALNPFK